MNGYVLQMSNSGSYIFVEPLSYIVFTLRQNFSPASACFLASVNNGCKNSCIAGFCGFIRTANNSVKRKKKHECLKNIFSIGRYLFYFFCNFRHFYVIHCYHGHSTRYSLWIPIFQCWLLSLTVLVNSVLVLLTR